MPSRSVVVVKLMFSFSAGILMMPSKSHTDFQFSTMPGRASLTVVRTWSSVTVLRAAGRPGSSS